MRFSYNKLWKLLIDRGIKKKDLGEMADTKALLAICNALNCDVGDIMEFVPDKKQEPVADDEKTSATSQ